MRSFEEIPDIAERIKRSKMELKESGFYWAPEWDSQSCCDQDYVNNFKKGWESRQTEVDELQASYHGKMIGHNHHLGKVKKERDELQKRIDGIKKIIREAYESDGNSSVEIVFDEVEQLEQALKGGGESQQSKIDELQKKNAWLSDVACRENKRANKLQEENVSTTTLLGKTIQEKNELQKRVDAAIRLLVEAELYQSEPNIDLAVQALNGGSDE